VVFLNFSPEEKTDVDILRSVFSLRNDGPMTYPLSQYSKEGHLLCHGSAAKVARNIPVDIVCPRLWNP
ncbi:hypothetical protein, partial [Pseudomonas poae]|uniref:hypothetical protein n=1 Tax=Pseudomonas poae TaxID=200451 RepID=UPI0034D5952E